MHIRTLVIAGLVLASLPAAADPLLTVTGRGSAASPATEARIIATADGRGPTTAEAIAAQHTAIANITKALVKLGVPERDVTVTGMNLNPQFGPGPVVPNQTRTITGYNYNTSIAVTVEHPDRLGDIVQALADAGVTQNTRVNFVAHDTEAAQGEAHALAVKDAFARAQVLAKQTGVTLGPVVSVTDGAAAPALVNYTEQLMANLTMMGGAPRTVNAVVTVSWAIKTP